MTKKTIFIVLFFSLVFAFAFYINGRNITGNVVYSSMDKDVLVVPVKAHIIKESSGYYSSLRDEENIINLFKEVNRIWSQAGIYIEVNKIVVTETSPRAIIDSLNSNSSEIYYHENYAQGKINIFFTKNLSGINGIALPHVDSALIADFTTVNDYRTTAHEIGHLLGLRHVQESNNLMAQGRNGEMLSESQIITARKNALTY